MYGNLKDHPDALDHYFRAHFGVLPADAPPTVIVTPLHFSSVVGGPLAEKLQQRGASVQTVKTALSGFGDSLLAVKGDASALFSIGGVGASLAVGHALLLAHAPKTERVLFYGTCGGLADHAQVYDLNVPERCIRGDGVTEDAFPIHIPAEADAAFCAEVRGRLHDSMRGTDKKVLSDLHYTVGSIFVETYEMLRRLQSGNVNTIDMELSVYYTVLGQAGKSVAGIVKIIDLPLKGVATFDGVKKNVPDETKSIVNGAIVDVLCGVCGF